MHKVKLYPAEGTAGADVNRGKLCIKGIFEYEMFDAAGRGDKPLMRNKSYDDYQTASLGSSPR